MSWQEGRELLVSFSEAQAARNDEIGNWLHGKLRKQRGTIRTRVAEGRAAGAAAWKDATVDGVWGEAAVAKAFRGLPWATYRVFREYVREDTLRSTHDVGEMEVRGTARAGADLILYPVDGGKILRADTPFVLVEVDRKSRRGLVAGWADYSRILQECPEPTTRGSLGELGKPATIMLRRNLGPMRELAERLGFAWEEVVLNASEVRSEGGGS